MASLHHLSPNFIQVISVVIIVMVTPSQSLTCTSQKLTKTYSTCTDLPALDAQLHYTYDASNSSLSIAFLAPATNSWIAWAINPTGVGMVGAQALIALKPESGSIVAKTLNIAGYHSIVESKLSFEVWDLSAEESSETIRLFGSVKVPAHATKVNQVWQVGSAVDGTSPRMHNMMPDNRNSKGTLELVAAGGAPAPGPSTNVDAAGAPASGPSTTVAAAGPPAPGPSTSVDAAGAPAPGPSTTVVAGPTPTKAVETPPVAHAAPPPAGGAPAGMMKGGIVMGGAAFLVMLMSFSVL